MLFYFIKYFATVNKMARTMAVGGLTTSSCVGPCYSQNITISVDTSYSCHKNNSTIITTIITRATLC